jgi:hypothetical protein
LKNNYSKYYTVLVWLILCIAGGYLMTWLSGMPLWAGFSITAVSLFINAVIADVEDKEPGAFLNPKDEPKQ